MSAYNKLRRVVEEFLADLEAFSAKVGVEARWEFVLTGWSCSNNSGNKGLSRHVWKGFIHVLFVPPLIQNTGHALDPFIYFPCFIPCLPAFSRASPSVFA